MLQARLVLESRPKSAATNRNPPLNLDPVTISPPVPLALAISTGSQLTHEEMTRLETASPRGARAGLLWAEVEIAPGHFNFSKYDPWVNHCSSRGITPILILCYGHPQYTGSASTPPRDAAAIAAFVRYAVAAANHYGHMATPVMFEIWNEPNLLSGKFWPPAPNATQYSTLALAVGTALHRLRQGSNQPGYETETEMEDIETHDSRRSGPLRFDIVAPALAGAARFGTAGAPTRRAAMAFLRVGWLACLGGGS